ncbi:hypothetical protein [Streptomyces sp. NPDC056160]|uniref:hypothetical protein n=1 Tax=Streptomyces sp. NPDC056160 TaxID=3345731 RepID=UPI0035D9B65D
MALTPELPGLAAPSVWSDTPQPSRAAVEAAVGPVLASGKAAACSTARLRLSLDTEARRAHAVVAIAPHMVHHCIVGDWRWLLFEYAFGRPAHLPLSSADHDAPARMLRRCASLLAPPAVPSGRDICAPP